MATKDPAMYVRLPADVKAFVVDQARRNASSMNSEVVRALRAQMDRDAARQRENVKQ